MYIKLRLNALLPQEFVFPKDERPSNILPRLSQNHFCVYVGP